MAKVHGKNAGLVMDVVDLGSVASSSSLAIAIDTAECTTFSSSAKEYIEGDYGFSGSFASYMSTGTGEWDDSAWSKVTTQGDDHYMLWEAPTAGAAHTAGNVCYEGIVRWTGQPREFSLTDAIIINGDIQGTDRLARGAVNYTGAVTGTGTQTAISHGTTTATQTLVITYRVMSVSGSGTVAFTINESQQVDGNPDTFAEISGAASGDLTAIGVTRKTVTAATEAFKQLECTTFSGFTSVTVLVTIAVAA